MTTAIKFRFDPPKLLYVLKSGKIPSGAAYGYYFVDTGVGNDPYWLCEFLTGGSFWIVPNNLVRGSSSRSDGITKDPNVDVS